MIIRLKLKTDDSLSVFSWQFGMLLAVTQGGKPNFGGGRLGILNTTYDYISDFNGSCSIFFIFNLPILGEKEYKVFLHCSFWNNFVRLCDWINLSVY